MASGSDNLTIISSLALRAACFVFLRWIPSPVCLLMYLKTLAKYNQVAARVAYTLFALYIPSFITSFLTQAQQNITTAIDISVDAVEEVQPPKLASVASHSHNVRAKGQPPLVVEDVVISETVTVEDKPKQAWWTLLTGLPSPTSALLSALTLLINVGLLLAVLDLTHRAKLIHPSQDLSFARLGFVSSNEANILIREPKESEWPVSLSYRIADPLNAAPRNTAWQHVTTSPFLTNATDFTEAIKLRLPASAEQFYQWKTSNNHTGSFTTPPAVGRFTKAGTFTFLTSSCILPNFPYNPLRHALSIPGFRFMAEAIKSLPGGAQFMLFVGDFIYVDVPKRFGVSAETYRREYRQVYSSPDWPLVGQNLSWIHVLDDHEIANDWDQGKTGIYEAAVDPWHNYHTSVNPPRALRAGSRTVSREGATYFEFTQGPASFFMLDTRTYRDKAMELPANSTEKSMLGQEQLEDLLQFLRKPEATGVKWKFVISSIPFTKNWRVNGIDTWGGYLHERGVILEAMWDVGKHSGVGVVVLSGDRHEFAATAFPPPAGSDWPISATVNEYSVGPLSQFYLPIPTYKQTDDQDVEVK